VRVWAGERAACCRQPRLRNRAMWCPTATMSCASGLSPMYRYRTRLVVCNPFFEPQALHAVLHPLAALVRPAPPQSVPAPIACPGDPVAMFAHRRYGRLVQRTIWRLPGRGLGRLLLGRRRSPVRKGPAGRRAFSPPTRGGIRGVFSWDPQLGPLVGQLVPPPPPPPRPQRYRYLQRHVPRPGPQTPAPVCPLYSHEERSAPCAPSVPFSRSSLLFLGPFTPDPRFYTLPCR